MKTNNTKAWEKEFDEKFIVLNSGQLLLRKQLEKEGIIQPKENIKELKSFISNLLKNHISHTEIKEILAGMEKEIQQPENHVVSQMNYSEDGGYNKALKEIKQKLCK